MTGKLGHFANCRSVNKHAPTPHHCTVYILPFKEENQNAAYVETIETLIEQCGGSDNKCLIFVLLCFHAVIPHYT